jgi:hypothetical protein
MKTIKLCTVILLLINIFSCTKNVDFDQIDAVEITPNYLITLVFFELYAPDFLDSVNTEVPIQVDLVRAPLKDLPQKNLEKVEFTIQTTNSFNRKFNAQIVFLDANNNPIYRLDPIVIPENSTELVTIIEIPTEDLHYIFETEFFAFFLELIPSDDGSTILPGDDSYIEFKSSIEVYLKYKTI